MKNSKVIVTLALGDRYLSAWKASCEANWKEYGDKHHYDITCLQEPLDNSERARGRSPAWQKCLILSQGFTARYDRVVWVDSDILINTRTAPSIVEEVPTDKVGAVEQFCYSKEAGKEMLSRMFDYWKSAILNPTPQEYYTMYGLAAGFDSVIQTGVLVLSPIHHRALLEKVYFEYEEKGGAEWHYEMRPLSYELLKAEAVHWIDPRFNLVWLDCVFMNYPFLVNPPRSRHVLSRAIGKAAKLAGSCSRDAVKRACMMATFFNSHFMHFGGSNLHEMMLVDTGTASWRECQI